MRNLTRLTYSDLSRIITESVRRVMLESNDALLLQQVAQQIASSGYLTATVGTNETEVSIPGGDCYIDFTVHSNARVRRGMRSSSIDVPDDPDEVIDDFTVSVDGIDFCSGGDCRNIQDNGLVARALENVVDIEYDMESLPSERYWDGDF